MRIVDDQMKHLDEQLQALDEILSKVRNQNTKHHDAHIESLAGLSTSVKQSYASIGDHLMESSKRAQAFEADVDAQATSLSASLAPLEQDIRVPLTDLRENVIAAPIVEYSPTGQTPQKQQYQYQTTISRTQPHDQLLRIFRGGHSHTESPKSLDSIRASPSKTTIYMDANDVESMPTPDSPSANRPPSRPQSSHSSLRELDSNVVSSATRTDAAFVSAAERKPVQLGGPQPPMKRQNTGGGKPRTLLSSASVADISIASIPTVEVKDFSASIGTKLPKRAPAAEGRENVPFAASVGSGARQLRSRGS